MFLFYNGLHAYFLTLRAISTMGVQQELDLRMEVTWIQRFRRLEPSTGHGESTGHPCGRCCHSPRLDIPSALQVHLEPQTYRTLSYDRYRPLRNRYGLKHLKSIWLT